MSLLGDCPSLPDCRRKLILFINVTPSLWKKEKENDSWRKFPLGPVGTSLLFEVVCNQTAFLHPFMDIYVI